MSSGTDTSTFGRFGAFLVQRSRREAASPWPHGAKVLLWGGLAVASWAAMISAGYLVWSAL
jgi:hypothetical protein